MKNHAFTLIELLVVILIIGILAAIALPQYQKAVQRSQAAKMIFAVHQLHNAQQRHFMSTGEIANSLDKLDINFSGPRMDEFTAVANGNCNSGTHLYGYVGVDSKNNVIDMGDFELGLASPTWRYALASMASLKGDHCRQVLFTLYPSKSDITGEEVPIETPLCYQGRSTNDTWCQKMFGITNKDHVYATNPAGETVSLSGSLYKINNF